LPVSLENVYAVQRDAAPTLAAGAAQVLERYRQRTQVREAVYGQPAEDPMELLARADRVLRQNTEAPAGSATTQDAVAPTPSEPPPALPDTTQQPEPSDPNVPF
jgi:hypothetical protein